MSATDAPATSIGFSFDAQFATLPALDDQLGDYGFSPVKSPFIPMYGVRGRAFFDNGAIVGLMADNACAWAGASVVGDVVTGGYTINFLRPALGEGKAWPDQRLCWGEEAIHRAWTSRGLQDRALRMRRLYAPTPVGLLRLPGGPRLIHELAP